MSEQAQQDVNFNSTATSTATGISDEEAKETALFEDALEQQDLQKISNLFQSIVLRFGRKEAGKLEEIRRLKTIALTKGFSCYATVIRGQVVDCCVDRTRSP